MAGKIFINYRRDDSIGTAGRLHDRLAEAFGRDKLFMDVDHIPAGVDFVAYLNDQVAACNVFLAIIGPNWLDAKDESGRRRLDKPDDFVAIEIAAALARNIRVIPVLLDRARMPTEDKLPDSLKSFARRNAVEVRNAHFGRDATELIAKMREGRRLRRWRRGAILGGAAVVMLSVAVWGIHRSSEEAPQRYYALVNQGTADFKAGDYDSAVARYSEAIRLDPKNNVAFDGRGMAYEGKGDYDRAIADQSEALRLDPNDVFALIRRGTAYARKGDYDRAIADFNEAIRLNPNSADVFNNRGFAYQRKGDYDQAIVDYNQALRLNSKYAAAFCNRGKAKLKIGDRSGDEDIAQAKQLNPSDCR
jgi:tetratricopeptide (TPR) repeat protein